MKKTKFKQGIFNIRHPERYIGNPENIRYMSGWELKFFRELDSDNPKFIGKWSSEELAIRYFDNCQQKWRRYYPDIILFPDNKKFDKLVIEIKPKNQINLPLNQMKFIYARQWCKENGFKFMILSDKYFKF